MRSIAAWLLLASVHQEPVPSQVTAAGSWAQVTRPGTTPRGTPSGENVDPNEHAAGSCNRKGEMSMRHLHSWLLLLYKNHVFRGERLETRVCRPYAQNTLTKIMLGYVAGVSDFEALRPLSSQ
jgi:hypothetical protein